MGKKKCHYKKALGTADKDASNAPRDPHRLKRDF
jgi:hypothetical protein